MARDSGRNTVMSTIMSIGSLVRIVNAKESRWNRYRVSKLLRLMVLVGHRPSSIEVIIRKSPGGTVEQRLTVGDCVV